MGIKWYRNGKLVPDENIHEENKLVIAKLGKKIENIHIPFYNHDYKETYFMGYLDDDGLFYMVDDISPCMPVSFSNDGFKLSKFKNGLNYTDIINIKLNHFLITNCHFKSWKYDYIKDIFGEDQIEFYK